MLGKRLVTAQTGPEGKPVQRVYIELADPFERESILATCSTANWSAYASSLQAWRDGDRGNRKELARGNPAGDRRAGGGLQPFQARELAFQLGLNLKQVSRAVQTILGAYRAFRDCDATMLEINPLVVTKDDKVLALDAKMSFDDNALFRRRNIVDMNDPSQSDPREAQALEHSLNYIGLMARSAASSMAPASRWPPWT